MFSQVAYKRLFFVGALWNLGIGLTGIVATNFAMLLFFGTQGADSIAGNLIATLFVRLFMSAVVIFGIGYYLVSLNLNKNRAVIGLGLISKILLFLIFTYLYFTGIATLLGFLTLVGDFVFSIFFIIWLVDWKIPERIG
ncbi:MAG: hypothetical protein ACM3QW_08340 [Ignavibacteriales bacterium]